MNAIILLARTLVDNSKMTLGIAKGRRNECLLIWSVFVAPGYSMVSLKSVILEWDSSTRSYLVDNEKMLLGIAELSKN